MLHVIPENTAAPFNLTVPNDVNATARTSVYHGQEDLSSAANPIGKMSMEHTIAISGNKI